MLISSDVSTLGRALHSDSPHLETKGIASFRSAVSTLNAHRARKDEITHDDFVAALTEEFGDAYPGHLEQHVVNEGDVALPKVWDGVKDLTSWEWQYGQTPEFTNRLDAELSIGRVTATLASRHALLTQFSLELARADEDAQDALNAISTALIGKRYEALGGAEADVPADVPPALAAEVLGWLRTSM
ncbi:hypothetical protein Q8F55_002224 [Vanrija albida]|uniref:Uncharacterized protein n=1 Tax=Vanrija albida TaxID=181172 RepID=A0ABR3QA74_9TREE